MTTSAHPTRLRTAGLTAALLTLSLLGACAGNAENTSDSAADATFTIGTVGEPKSGDPTRGGRLDVSTFGEVPSFDPVDVIANGLAGGTELAAIYDVLLRYDPDTGDYEPQLAEGIESNDASTRYTLSLRDGVTFSDGRPLDAKAVVASIERYLEREGGQSSLWRRKVARTRAVDAHTVEFAMTQPWLDFEYMLATAPGMIVAEAADRGGKFTPIGAGPFTFGDHRPGEELLLEANPDYWGGAPHLDELRFTTIQTAQGTLDVAKSGDADVAVMREPNVIADAVRSGLSGSMNVVSLGVGLILNNREGSVTEDVKVRQAIALALDPQTIIDRSYQGVGLPGTEMFPDESQWHSDAGGPEIDLDKARALVEEAKGKGFDGTVRYLGIAKVSQNTGLAIEAMLGQIGIKVESEYVPGASEMIDRVFVKRDFDLAGWSFGTPDAAVFPELFESFHSESSSNAGGYSSATMDGLIEDLGAAGTEGEQRKVIAAIQEEWNRTVPAIVFGAQPEYVAWGDQVGGVTPHVDSMVLFDKAWVTG